jgi:hypothetical protein
MRNEAADGNGGGTGTGGSSSGSKFCSTTLALMFLSKAPCTILAGVTRLTMIFVVQAHRRHQVHLRRRLLHHPRRTAAAQTVAATQAMVAAPAMVEAQIVAEAEQPRRRLHPQLAAPVVTRVVSWALHFPGLCL